MEPATGESQCDDPVAKAVRLWCNQAQKLPSGALLSHIDATLFSASKASETAVLHLRAVTIPCPTDRNVDELLIAQLKAAHAINDASLKAAEEMLDWSWPKYPEYTGAAVASFAQGSNPSAPETPASRHMRPKTPSAPTPKRTTSSTWHAPPHHRFCTMVSNMKLHDPTPRPDATESATYADVLGPFVLPWAKYGFIMDHKHFPPKTPPRLHAAPAIRRTFGPGSFLARGR